MFPLDPDATLPPPTGPANDATLNYAPDGPAGADDTRTLPPSDAPTATDTHGQPEVPGFELLQELGRGGMGVVYLARQVRLNRQVAIKMVLAGGHASAQDRLRFLAEAESVAAVQHPGIVQVFEFGTAGEQPYFALEFCPGGSLAAKLAGTPLPPKDAAALVEQVATAVQAAHDKGIVHRDLKPDNVLFAADGTPKVTDFGLARKVEGDSGLTRTGAIMGTPSYMAPEQAAGQAKAVGPPADVYALGAILYECLTGRPPFRAATALDTVLQVANEEPVSPRKLVPKLPKDLETICLKCLNKEPGKRYASAADLAADLGRFRAGEPISARPVSGVEKVWRQTKKRPLLALTTWGCVALIAWIIGSTVSTNQVLRESDRLTREALASSQRSARDFELARQDAVAARDRARQRLEKAVEAVDKMMVRVAGEKWANKPELAEERRQVLEEAVAFFQSFGAEDSKDPAVRRQTVKAYLQTAVAYMALGDYGKGQQAARSAAGVAADLVADRPDNADALRLQAEAVSFLGHFTAIGGQFAEAITYYSRAAELAERAAKLDPDSLDAQVTLSECYTSLGQFYQMQDPDRSAAFFRKALAVGEALTARPNPSYRGRLAKLVGLTNLGAFELTRGQGTAAFAKLEQANKLVGPLAAEPAPTARAGELYGSARAALAVYRALYLTGTPDKAAAVASVNEGLAQIDRLLAAHPKSFPMRMQKLSFLSAAAGVYNRAGRGGDADAAVTRMRSVQTELLKEFPHMTWIAGIAAVQVSGQLVGRAKYGDDQGLDAEFEAIVRAAPPGVKDLVNYNWVCAHSILSRTGPADRRADRAERAVKLLNELLAGPYFRNPVTANHLDKDEDLDPLRDRADYKEFREKVRKLVPPKK